MTREQQLEKALRDLVNEPSLYTQQAARELLADNEPTYCSTCGRMKTNHYGPECSACLNSD